MRVREAFFAWLCLVMPRSAMAQAPLFNSPPLSDEELSEERGGFMLGSDVRIDFGAVVTTSVDGLRVLQSQLRINDSGVTGGVTAIPGVNLSINGVPSGGEIASDADGNISISVISNDPNSSPATVDDFLRVSAELPDLAVQQVLGRAISSVIVNTADNRTVDNHIAISLRLDNVQPLTLGSVGFQVQAMSMDAALLRSR